MRLFWVITIVVLGLLAAYDVRLMLDPRYAGGGHPAPVAQQTAKRPPVRHVATKVPAKRPTKRPARRVAAKVPAVDATISPFRSKELLVLLASSVGLCIVFAGACLRTDLGTARFIVAALVIAILGCVEILEMST